MSKRSEHSYGALAVRVLVWSHLISVAFLIGFGAANVFAYAMWGAGPWMHDPWTYTAFVVLWSSPVGATGEAAFQ